MCHLANNTNAHGLNDPDMLEVGNGGMSTIENETHFSFWVAFKSPLLMGTDVGKMTTDTKRILTNKAVIAINKDPLRKSIIRHVNNVNQVFQVWTGPLANGATVLVVLNTRKTDNDIYVDLLQDAGILNGEIFGLARSVTWRFI
jgi:alpha-galactosidase